MATFKAKALVEIEVSAYYESQAEAKIKSLPVAFSQQGVTFTFLTEPEIKKF